MSFGSGSRIWSKLMRGKQISPEVAEIEITTATCVKMHDISRF